MMKSILMMNMLLMVEPLDVLIVLVSCREVLLPIGLGQIFHHPRGGVDPNLSIAPHGGYRPGFFITAGEGKGPYCGPIPPPPAAGDG